MEKVIHNNLDWIIQKMDLAEKYGEDKSPCLKKQVGAYLIKLYRRTEKEDVKTQLTVLGKGYGGFVEPCGVCIRKTETWTQDGCWSIHAEARAIADSGLSPDRLKLKEDICSLVMLVTHGPCDQCLKTMVFHKIDKVIFKYPYKTNYSKWSKYIKVYQLTEEGTLEVRN